MMMLPDHSHETVQNENITTPVMWSFGILRGRPARDKGDDCFAIKSTLDRITGLSRFSKNKNKTLCALRVVAVHLERFR